MVTDHSTRIVVLERAVQPLNQTVAKPVRSGGGGLAHQIAAPFEVISSSGEVLLRVAERVPARADPEARITFGPGEGGNTALRVFSKSGVWLASIGESSLGDGIVAVENTAGKVRAWMGCERGKSVRVRSHRQRSRESVHAGRR